MNTTFKKRSLPQANGGNVRKRKVDTETEEEDLALAKLREVKHLQDSRTRKNGISAEELAHSQQSSSSSSSLKEGSSNKTTEKTVETMLGSQFSSHGLGTTVPHEKIMEAYINEKLGLLENDRQSTRKLPDDDIYKIPEELKGLPFSSTTKKGEHEEEVVATWSTGIAEVVLPSSFKAKNIKDTEAAARRRQQEEEDRRRQNRLSNEIKGGFQRFHVPYDSMVPPTVLQSKEASTTQDSSNLPTDSIRLKGVRPQRASDDKVFSQYKKKQQEMVRF
eukprot:scaffold296_cov164-Ochromonas_danica.AAC.10